MVHIHDIFDLDALQERIDKQYVNVRYHPDGGLRVLNYSKTCQYSNAWDEVTVACRGLIIDDEGNVLARPYAKFFNYGEHVANMPYAPALTQEDLTQRAVVMDKVDGSLGVLFPAPDGAWAVSTRGSFESKMAIHATGLLRHKYPEYVPPEGVTVMMEIIYPAQEHCYLCGVEHPSSRVVIDYGDMDDLVLLGGVDIETGRTVPLETLTSTWPGPSVEVMAYASLSEALSAPDRRQKEGFVVHFPDRDLRVKVKQDDYVRLSRILSGLNELAVWEQLFDHGNVDTLLEDVPDEFYDWVHEVESRLRGEHAAILDDMRTRTALHVEASKSHPDYGTNPRKAVALTMGKEADELMQVYVGSLDPKKLWKKVRPSGAYKAAVNAPD